MMKPPKEFLVDSFEYLEVIGTNDWNEPEYGEPIEIEFCRIDDGSQYTSTTSGTQLLYNGLIFCYADLTEPMKEFKVGSIARYNETDHRIVNVVPIKELYSDNLYAYELGVI